ncbi:hypothetical protein RIF23_13630 [Lipingzhangella sp. LS1_29]|uniref:Uncharacterized protein n=1 Tax=Lipingzhangella rawalii TaxID=2055835 RepID=A0ABU2H7S6_9ACTN|nr:hypothetical protein [Lipingzhangella rawalii]MDS1271338.1 hypothetical protein [Lipingzhangella rawalii]
MPTVFFLRSVVTPTNLNRLPSWRWVVLERLEEGEPGEFRDQLYPWMREMLAGGDTFGLFCGEYGLVEEEELTEVGIPLRPPRPCWRHQLSEACSFEPSLETCYREELIVWDGSQPLFREIEERVPA